MTNEQILKKAIEKAVKNGFDFPKWLRNHLRENWENQEDFIFYQSKDCSYYSLLFSHDFAEAFWKGKPKWKTKEERQNLWLFDEGFFNGKRWQYHLQQMVLEEEPLKYIEKFL